MVWWLNTSAHFLKMQKQPPEVFFKKRYQACNFNKKETLAQVFSRDFCKFSKNSFFTEHVWATASKNAVKSWNICPKNLILGDTTNLGNPVEIAIKKFKNRPSVQIIKEQVSTDDILEKTKTLDKKKNGTFKNIPCNRVKEVSKVTAPCLTNAFEYSNHKLTNISR